MKRLALALLLVPALAGCSAGPAVVASPGWTDQFNTNIGRWHDSTLPVTCWTARQYGSGGIAISCLPDSEIK